MPEQLNLAARHTGSRQQLLVYVGNLRAGRQETADAPQMYYWCNSTVRPNQSVQGYQ